ncbi:hypothetical protein [Pseudoduganella violaceinigra]|uniref:hypothetical protein n=1 Tax=Pseudoduganella violaceinigra TaxID=246602 RepID=UPI0003FA4034|nr:hypothetical protein [Pseudoduganella violaceinigra]
MKNTKKLMLLGAALILSACAKKEVPPAVAEPVPAQPVAAEAKKRVSAETVRMMELLRAVYGNEGAHEDYLVAQLPDHEEGHNATGSYRLEPVAMHELPDGRVAVVANAQQLDEQGEAMAYHATSGLLSAYILRKDGGKWTVEARHENIAEVGSNGVFGQVQWVSLGQGKPGFMVRHGGTWQGASVEFVSIFDLADGPMHDLAHSLSLSSDNEGACGEETSHCWSIEGKLQFEKREGAAFDDVVLRFTGFEENRGDDAPKNQARQHEERNGMARYKFDGQSYVLIEGENIVPGV